MQVTNKPRRASKKVIAATVEVNMLGAGTAAAAPMDPELAALLNVLNDPSEESAGLELVEQTNAAPSDDIIEQSVVESLDVSAAPVVVIEQHAEPQTHEVEAAVAGLEVAEAYALTPADAAPLEGASAHELEAERLLAEEALIQSSTVENAEPAAGDEAGTAPKKERTPRVHYANKTDRIKARLGAQLGDYLVLELDDAALEGDALKAKQDETLAVIDGMAEKVKNRASLLIDWLSGKTGKPNEILKRALDVLAADGKIQTGDNGNLHKNLLSKPYSPSAARAMGRNTVTVMEKTKMIVQSGKGEFVPNPSSLFLAMANEMVKPAAGPAATTVVEETKVEETSAAE
jgi:hypothetical protein